MHENRRTHNVYSPVPPCIHLNFVEYVNDFVSFYQLAFVYFFDTTYVDIDDSFLCLSYYKDTTDL